MADFVWDYSGLSITSAIDGGELIFVNAPGGELTIVSDLAGSVQISNPYGLADLAITSSLSGEFVKINRALNIVRWSDIDNLNFELSPQNIAGWKALEWEGEAWRGIKYKNSVIVYGSGGISILIPVSEPISSWSELVVDRSGILGKDTVVATQGGHLYIGKDYQLYQMGDDSQSLRTATIPVIKLLGYKEFLKTLTLPIRMFHDPTSKITFIAGRNKTFVFSDGELTSLPITLTGYLHETIPLVTYADTTVSNLVVLRTQELRFGNTNFKTLRSIAFDIDMLKVSNPVCKIYTRDKTTQLFTKVRSCKVTKDGMAFPRITDKEFQISIEFIPLERTAVRSAQITVQYSDKRFGFGGTDVKQIIA